MKESRDFVIPKIKFSFLGTFGIYLNSGKGTLWGEGGYTSVKYTKAQSALSHADGGHHSCYYTTNNSCSRTKV